MAGERVLPRDRAAVRFPIRSWPLRYALAPASALLALAIQLTLFPRPSHASFELFVVGVVLTSWLGGRGPGLVATALSAALGSYFVSGGGLLAAVLFAATGVAISLLSGSVRVATVGGAPPEQGKAQESVGQSEEHLGTVEDITERKRAERERARLTTIVEETSDFVATADMAGRVVYYNKAARRMLGIGEGEDYSKVRIPETHPEWANAIVLNEGIPAAVQGRIWSGETALLSRDGREIPISQVIIAHRAPGGTVEYVSTIARDITDRKRAEQERERMVATLREADQRKNEFLGVLSHELRNPLTPIRNSLDILHRVAPGGEQARRAQSVIDRQVSHLANLVDDLLDVTRIERGKIRLQRMCVDLVDVARRTIEDHRTSLGRHQVAVELPDEALCVDGDPTRLVQMIGNLLSNAAKFTPMDGKISVSVKGARGRAVLEVADTGVGIDQDMLDRLFVPFAQADRSLIRSQGGLGLGLALVKGLAELHGGTVNAHSEGPGKGARFTLELPLVEQVAVAPATPPPQKAAGSGRKVLLIEDNVDAADSLRELLQLDGHEVVVAHNGKEGIAKAHELKPDVLLCDIGLPEMDGYQIARAFRADAALQGVFLVALTGHAGPDDRQRATEAGFERLLAKPPALKALEALLAAPETKRSRRPEASAPAAT